MRSPHLYLDLLQISFLLYHHHSMLVLIQMQFSLDYWMILPQYHLSHISWTPSYTHQSSSCLTFYFLSVT
jgi:hypothetical protein